MGRGEDMEHPFITLIFFLYGLPFFSMGLAIVLEIGRASDQRMRHALRPLATFGFLHGAHEWLEMFELLGVLSPDRPFPDAMLALRIAVLAWSFLSLSAFGVSLLAPDERARRISLLAPVAQAALWGFGLLTLRGRVPGASELWVVADVWSRYTLAVPAALLASAGLVTQQRVFRRAGLERFGRDSLWAAVAFAWYGVVGQVFVHPSWLWPSTVVNQDLFLRFFGFPVQFLRATAALVAAVFIIRTLRSFEVERQRQIAKLQAARLREAERREVLRRELLRRVVTAQEAERQRIARELHDETGQALTAIGLGLRGAETSLLQDVDKAARQLRHLESLVARSLDELQRVIADLRPAHLDDLGLPAALRWYCSELMERTPLRVRVDVIGEPRPIPSPVKTALFRIAQEALTNVVKHACADNATVTLIFDEGEVSLRVTDDGVGFDLGMIQNIDRPTWGLLGMEERATLLGGRLNLDSVPGQGTRVEVVIPYRDGKGRDDDDTLAVGG